MTTPQYRARPVERFYVRDGDGNVYRMTPSEWAARDRFRDFVRIDDHGNEVASDDARVPIDAQHAHHDRRLLAALAGPPSRVEPNVGPNAEPNPAPNAGPNEAPNPEPNEAQTIGPNDDQTDPNADPNAAPHDTRTDVAAAPD